jgi:hypothetical protein
MEQAFGIPYRIVAEDSELTYVYPGRCRLIGLFCASVGLTGLPTDPATPPVTPPPGTNPPPTVTSMTPVEGPNGTEVTIVGTGFQPQGEHTQIKVGTADAVILSWTETEVKFTAIKGQNVDGAPLAVWLRPNDKQDVNAGAFTFGAEVMAAAASTGRHERGKDKSGKKAKVAEVRMRRNLITGVDVPGLTTVEGFPVFESGAGIMLRDADGTILVGPVELTPGFMPFNVECPDGIDVVPSGNFDITLLLAHGL